MSDNASEAVIVPPPAPGTTSFGPQVNVTATADLPSKKMCMKERPILPETAI